MAHKDAVATLRTRTEEVSSIVTRQRQMLRELTMDDAQYKELVRVLTSECRPPRKFRLVCPPDRKFKPETGVVAKLRELVSGGMEIHLGTENKYYI